MCVKAFVFVYMFTRVYAYRRLCVCVCMCVCVYVCMCICVCGYMRIFVYVYMCARKFVLAVQSSAFCGCERRKVGSSSFCSDFIEAWIPQQIVGASWNGADIHFLSSR